MKQRKEDRRTNLIKLQHIGAKPNPLSLITPDIPRHPTNSEPSRDHKVTGIHLVELHQAPIGLPLGKPHAEVRGEIKPETQRLERSQLHRLPLLTLHPLADACGNRSKESRIIQEALRRVGKRRHRRRRRCRRLQSSLWSGD